MTNGSSLNQDPLTRNVSLPSRTEHRTFYDDPVSVRQWAAETDLNTPVNSTEYGFPDSTYGIDAPGVCDAPPNAGSFPVSCSSVSHNSFPVIDGLQGDTFGVGGAYPDPNGMARSLGDPLGIETYSGSELTGNYETWSYPTPTAEDMTYSTSTVSCLPFNGESSIEPRFSDWSTGFPLLDNEVSREDFSRGSQNIAWSPMLATDPSMSSSYSRSSYLAMQANTPLSPVAQEPDWPLDQSTCPEEPGFYPAFSLGEPSQLASYPAEHHDPMR